MQIWGEIKGKLKMEKEVYTEEGLAAEIWEDLKEYSLENSRVK